VIKKNVADFTRQIKQDVGVGSNVQMLRTLHKIGMLLELNIKQQIIGISLVDQGHLLNSIRYSVDLTDEGGVVTIGSYGVKYAAIHEYGGVILPVKAKRLTIPHAPWAKYHVARDFQLVRIKNMLVDRSKLIPGSDKIPDNAIGFWLVKKSTIKEKRYMRDGIQKSKSDIISTLRAMG